MNVHTKTKAKEEVQGWNKQMWAWQPGDEQSRPTSPGRACSLRRPGCRLQDHWLLKTPVQGV
jgi:hypothetical protein